MQRIEIVIGDPVDAATMQEILTSLADPGILNGFQLTTTSSNTIAVQPGAALLDSGVLLVEDEVVTLPFQPTITPSTYTVYYSYIPSSTYGGNPAVLNISSGLIPAQGFTNGVVLGWIQYPGSSAALNAATMFLSAPRFRLSQPQAKMQNEFQTLYSPIASRWSQVITQGTLTVSESYDPTYLAPVTQITNTGQNTKALASYLVPFRVPSYGIGQVEVWAQTDAKGAFFSVYLQDSQGNQITPTNALNIFTSPPNIGMTRNILS